MDNAVTLAGRLPRYPRVGMQWSISQRSYDSEKRKRWITRSYMCENVPGRTRRESQPKHRDDDQIEEVVVCVVSTGGTFIGRSRDQAPRTVAKP